MSALTASAVSAGLRRAGLNPLGSGTPRTREGIRVTRGCLLGLVSIAVDIDLPRQAEILRVAVVEALTEQGLTVTPNPHDPMLMTVERVQS